METRYEDEMRGMNGAPYERPKFTSEFIKENFRLDLDRNYDNDVNNWDGDTYICVDIVTTDSLIEILDHIRMEQGYTPISMENENGDRDWDTWYSFQFYFYKDGHIELTGFVDGPESNDNCSYYELDPTREEQLLIFEHLNESIIQNLEVDIAAELRWR